MNGHLADFVSELFANAPATEQARELREEMTANLQDKYDDLLKNGTDPDEAYRSVIANVGDVQELIATLEKPADRGSAEIRDARKKAALMTSIGIVLCILSPLSSILIYSMGAPDSLAGVGFFLFVAAGVGLLVYNNIANNPRYMKSGDDLVEEFKAFSLKRERDRRIKGTLIACFVALVIPLYFVISFVTEAWEVTWVLFLLIPLFTAAINVYYAFKE